MSAAPPDDASTDTETAHGAGASGSAAHARLVLEDVTTERDASSGVAVTVELGWEGEVHSGSARGVGSSTVEIRLGAEAALEALCLCADDAEFARLVGVKTVHAFDSHVILVSVRCEAAPGRNLVGAVPVGENDTTRTAAAAVLDAVNRVVGPVLGG